MSWFTDLFTSGVDAVIGTIGSVIDNLSTTDEEKLAAKLELEKELNNFKKYQLDSIATYDKEISKRHLADMQSDSWLSKNIRPLALAFLTVTTVLLAYLTIFILEENKVTLLEPWLGVLLPLLLIAYGFYFGGRSYEKSKKIEKG